MSRRSVGKRRFLNYLPARIGEAVLRDLSKLVDELAQENFKGAYLQSQYLSKYRDSNTTPADIRRQAAINKWLAAEAKNARTNQRLMVADPDMDFGWTTWGKLRAVIRDIVRSVLGAEPRYPDILMESAHTNGASTRVKRGELAAIHKLAGEAHVTERAVGYWVSAAIGTRLITQDLCIVSGSSLFTVPKTSEIDRVACKEPEINMFLQRSIGNFIRRRLKGPKFGINLNDQTRNQELARTAVERQLATIDLSAASDSISWQLVTELLPGDWWFLLDDLRVKETSINGRTHELEMFSSMGNGFTFELESLLFYAITRAVCKLSGIRGTISVYGDDIIAPCKAVRRMQRVFDFLGFKMNPKKTAWTGKFRESCGRHYYGGVAVTPFYVREPLKTISGLIRLLNQLHQWEIQGGHRFIEDSSVLSFHMKYSKLVPACLWGGQDLESSDSLVTGHAPRKRIQRESKSLSSDENHRLTTWFVQRRLTNSPLDVSPSKMTHYILCDHPAFTELRDYEPWLLSDLGLTYTATAYT